MEEFARFRRRKDQTSAWLPIWLLLPELILTDLLKLLILKLKKARLPPKYIILMLMKKKDTILPMPAFLLDEKGKLLPKKVEARIKGEPGEIEREKIDFIDVSSEQCISIATSLIPFLQNDDANRALMGSNMQRQGSSFDKTRSSLWFALE